MASRDKEIREIIFDECKNTLEKVDKIREEKGDRYAIGYLKASMKYIKSLSKDA